MVLVEFVILGILLLLSAIFSGMETALMSINNIKVKALLKKNIRGSEALFRLKENPSKLIITILIINNLVNIGAASLATVVFTDLFGSSGVGIATGVMTFMVLAFGEITPKTFATKNSERISLIVARPLEILSKIMFPLVKLFELISNLLTGSGEDSEKLSEEELKNNSNNGKRTGTFD